MLCVISSRALKESKSLCLSGSAGYEHRGWISEEDGDSLPKLGSDPGQLWPDL